MSGKTVIELAKRAGVHRPPRPPRTQPAGRLPRHACDPHLTRRSPSRAPLSCSQAPRATTVGAAVEGIQHVYEAPGEVRFRLGGRDLALTAFNGHVSGTPSLLFTDPTSGTTTYAANRSLSVAPVRTAA